MLSKEERAFVSKAHKWASSVSFSERLDVFWTTQNSSSKSSRVVFFPYLYCIRHSFFFVNEPLSFCNARLYQSATPETFGDSVNCERLRTDRHADRRPSVQCASIQVTEIVNELDVASQLLTRAWLTSVMSTISFMIPSAYVWLTVRYDSLMAAVFTQSRFQRSMLSAQISLPPWYAHILASELAHNSKLTK